MKATPASLSHHRASSNSLSSTTIGNVRYSVVKSAWFSCMAGAAIVGGYFTFSWAAVWLFVISTGIVLLLGHSLGSHRKLIHNSYQCPRWLEFLFVYLGVLVGLAGPLGLLRQHELRDYAQRLRPATTIFDMAARFGSTVGGKFIANLSSPIRQKYRSNRRYRINVFTSFWNTLGWRSNYQLQSCFIAGADGVLSSGAYAHV
ncbi:hypothetical protein [Undibacterium sp. SXout20W]|uniref:hypothetical protein n=1 Tax=Undibacterium sp. SXout20W TaxID=3413051 RepID=UPI003BF23E8F